MEMGVLPVPYSTGICFVKGAWLTEYLSISRIISRSKRQYEKAYLYTECDGNDLGYFVAYHLRAVSLAYNELRQYIQRKIDDQQQTSDFLKLGNINARQAQIIKWYNDSPNLSFSVKEIQTRMECILSDGKRGFRGTGKTWLCRHYTCEQSKKHICKEYEI